MNQDYESSCTGSSDKEIVRAEHSESDGEEAENLELSDADADADNGRNIAVLKQKKTTFGTISSHKFLTRSMRSASYAPEMYFMVFLA